MRFADLGKHIAVDTTEGMYFASIVFSSQANDMSLWGRLKLKLSVPRKSLKSIAQFSHHPPDHRSSIPEDILDDCFIAGNFHLLDDLAAYLNDQGLLEPDGSGAGANDNFTPAHYLNIPGHVRYSKASPSERAYQHTLIQAAYLLGESHTASYSTGRWLVKRFIDCQPLRAYLKAHPTNVREAAHLIKSRGIAMDADGINTVSELIAMANDVSAPLMEGAL